MNTNPKTAFVIIKNTSLKWWWWLSYSWRDITIDFVWGL